MNKTYVIQGNKELNGEVNISGSKNAALCLLAAALLTQEKTILFNIPNISDIRYFIEILSYLNVKTEFNDNVLKIDPSSMEIRNLRIPQVSKFRASYYLIGALISKFKKLKINMFGGCDFVDRPINYHLDMFASFGVNYSFKDDYYEFEFNDNLNDRYRLPYPSFGATINAILFAVSLKRKITIENICLDIEIQSFIDFLIKMGAKIVIDGNNIVIKAFKLKGCSFKNIPDKIESGNFILMGPLICSKLKVNNIRPLDNKAIFDLLSSLDVEYELGDDYVVLHKSKITKSCIINTGINQNISSDLQPLLSVFCLNIPRISIIKEKVYKSRFTHIEPLKKMGGFILESNQNILINGIMTLIGQKIVCTDLRMTSAMIFASLCAEGESVLYHGEYLDRGYENLINKLRNLGADIKVYES